MCVAGVWRLWRKRVVFCYCHAVRRPRLRHICPRQSVGEPAWQPDITALPSPSARVELEASARVELEELEEAATEEQRMPIYGVVPHEVHAMLQAESVQAVIDSG